MDRRRTPRSRHTARLSEPHEGCPGYRGYLQEDQESLRRSVLHAYAVGWSLALHAVGDAALDLALDMIEEGSPATAPARSRTGWSTALACRIGVPASRLVLMAVSV